MFASVSIHHQYHVGNPQREKTSLMKDVMSLFDVKPEVYSHDSHFFKIDFSFYSLVFDVLFSSWMKAALFRSDQVTDKNFFPF